MVHIHVQAHTDGIGGDQEIDIARLVQRYLCVAGTGRQGPQHHGSATALAADDVGQGINLLRREADNGAAAGQAGELLRSRIGEVGEARPRVEPGLGHEFLDQAARAFAAQQQRLFLATRMQQPVGEDMAALWISAKLNLVDHQTGDADIQRHRFNGADPPARGLGNDLFLAGDQRHIVGSLEAHDAVIDLPRQQPQRQADHAGLVCQHPFDGEMGLAGVGGAQNGGDFGWRQGAGAHGPTIGVLLLGPQAKARFGRVNSKGLRSCCGWMASNENYTKTKYGRIIN